MYAIVHQLALSYNLPPPNPSTAEDDVQIPVERDWQFVSSYMPLYSYRYCGNLLI